MNYSFDVYSIMKNVQFKIFSDNCVNLRLKLFNHMFIKEFNPNLIPTPLGGLTVLTDISDSVTSSIYFKSTKVYE